MLSRSVSALYADASVLINLIATNVAAEILRSVGVPVLIARPAADEVVRDPRKETTGRARLEELVRVGVLEIAELGPPHWARFIDLVGAPQPDDLGDGEAATICMAEISAAAIALDDAKAIRIARQSPSELHQFYTVDLFIHACRSGSLSTAECRKALSEARALSRMRIPHARTADLLALELLTA